MPFNAFVAQANDFGKQRQPFFFLIDFEQKKPLIWPLDQIEKAPLYFEITGKTNYHDKLNRKVRSKTPLHFTAFSLDPQRYQQGFEQVQQALQQGNSYLLNLTYPTEIQTNFSLLDFFEQSQARYKLYYPPHFVCFSPECFIKIKQNQIFTYPMKGTIDANLPNAEQQLLQSEKEQAEHYTIVDLMRNDLATVAQQIEVRRFRYVERIETEKGAILQTSSEIIGNLRENWQENIGTILAQLLPAGSISGAPKEKTVEIIQQAEGQERGYYTGVFGIFDGESVDSAVAIRFIEQCDGKLYFRSGGGITRKSQLDQEYNELLQKIYVPLGKT
ncbi:aminodeoxychorismate synthase component I [Lonepinella sp. BR2357]|uniref:aminodeoxychorismate synthase component I n=1 Tax=Lonepinella sp. BR2357 TaxID=3434549 RepID=UPI003F6E0A5C